MIYQNISTCTFPWCIWRIPWYIWRTDLYYSINSQSQTSNNLVFGLLDSCQQVLLGLAFSGIWRGFFSSKMSSRNFVFQDVFKACYKASFWRRLEEDVLQLSLEEDVLQTSLEEDVLQTSLGEDVLRMRSFCVEVVFKTSWKTRNVRCEASLNGSFSTKFKQVTQIFCKNM